MGRQGGHRGQRKASRLPQWATRRPIFAASSSANRKWMPDHTRASTMSAHTSEKLVNVRVTPPGVVPLNVACAKAGLVAVGIVAVDGTKIAAAATHHATRSYGQIASEILEEAAEIDAAEDELYSSDMTPPRAENEPDYARLVQPRGALPLRSGSDHSPQISGTTAAASLRQRRCLSSHRWRARRRDVVPMHRVPRVGPEWRFRWSSKAAVATRRLVRAALPERGRVGTTPSTEDRHECPSPLRPHVGH
jgi:hypothetical protein